jgi:1-acyl-sn-glycerol-3-phosphate acyltransferase
MDLHEKIKIGIFKNLNKLAKFYFQMEFIGQENLPKSEDDNYMFVMNHTAFFGLEVYLLASHLLTVDQGFIIKTLIWEKFMEGPMGHWYRHLDCISANINSAAKALDEGDNILVLPEGTDATDVRNRINRFHTGYLRILQQTPKTIIPIGFHGIDQAMPWLVTTNRFIVEKMAEPLGLGMDYYVFPKFPILRPTKIVFSIGEPIVVSPKELSSELKLQAKNQEIKNTISDLMRQAEHHREEKINSSPIRKLFHKIIDGTHTILPPPF